MAHFGWSPAPPTHSHFHQPGVTWVWLCFRNPLEKMSPTVHVFHHVNFHLNFQTTFTQYLTVLVIAKALLLFLLVHKPPLCDGFYSPQDVRV